MPPKALYRIVARLFILASTVLLLTPSFQALAQATSNPDTYQTDINTPLSIDAPGVLLNDGNTGSVTAVLETGPANGTVTLNTDGAFLYTPNANVTGNDTFTYRAVPATGSPSAPTTVTIEIRFETAADSYQTNFNTPLTVPTDGVLGNDSAGQGVIPRVVTPPSSGILSLNANGSFTYTPDVNVFGPVTFTYDLVDRLVNPTINSNDSTVTIDILYSAVDDSYDTPLNTPLVVEAPGIIGNDAGAAVTVKLDTNIITAAEGTLTLNPNGGFVYEPPLDFSGTVDFTYRLTNGTVDSPNFGTVTINVLPLTANPDDYTTSINTTLVVLPAQGVRANDIGAGVSAAVVSNVSNGTLNLEPDGSFTYRPNDNFVGTDTFTYRLENGSLFTPPVQVTITVKFEAVDDAYAIDTSVDLPIGAAEGLLANDTFGPNTTIVIVTPMSPAQGTIVLDTRDGSFTYTPATSFEGSATFTYRLTNGIVNSNTATVTITVPPPPTLVAINDFYIAQQDVVSFDPAPGVKWNDIFPDGTSPIPEIVTLPTRGTLIELNDDGSWRYQPNAGVTGDDSFQYRLRLGRFVSNTATVVITLIPAAPFSSVDDSYEMCSGDILNVSAPGVMANDENATGASAVQLGPPTNGAVVLRTDGSFTYTPDPAFVGVATFDYYLTITFPDPGGDITVNSLIATVSVNVVDCTGIFDAVDDAYSTGLNTPISDNVLANDIVTVAPATTASLVVPPTPIGAGTLAFNSDGTFTFTPTANVAGLVTFQYRITNGVLTDTATVTIEVKFEAVDDAYTTDINTPLNVAAAQGVRINDLGGTANAEITSLPGNGTVTLQSDGSFLYTPGTDFFGRVSFSYRLRSGAVTSNIATVVIDVLFEAIDDAYDVVMNVPLSIPARGVLVNDRAVGASAVQVAALSPAAAGTVVLNADGSFTYTPASNFTGQASFTYRARTSGGQDSNEGTVVLDVKQVLVAAADTYNTPINTVLNQNAAGGVLSNDTALGPNISVFLNDPPTSGALDFNPDGSFIFTPDTNFVGRVDFTYLLTDGFSDPVVGSVRINVTSTLSAVDDTYTVAANTPLTVNTAAGLRSNDTWPGAPGGTVPTIVLPLISNIPAGTGTLNVNADGSFTYTPATNFAGDVSFQYRLTDGSTFSNTATATISVTQPATPTVVDDTYTTPLNTALNVPGATGVLANDSGTNLTASLVPGSLTPGSGTVTLNADGSFVYTPATDFVGDAVFLYIADDGFNPTQGQVTITVTSTLNANDDVYETPLNTPLTPTVATGLLVNDVPNTGTITLETVGLPSGGTVTLNPSNDGTFTYTPPNNTTGTFTFQYRYRIGADVSNIATVTINVPNPASPIADDDQYTTPFGAPPLTIAAPGVLINDSSPAVPPLPLTAQIVNDITPGTGTLVLNANGSFTYTPEANFVGITGFSYVATDGFTSSNLALVTIRVTSPLTANDDPDYVTPVRTQLNVNAAQGVLTNDVPNTGVTVEIVTPPANAADFVMDVNTGAFTYTPLNTFAGADTFTYRTRNSGGVPSNVATATITVQAPPPPVAADDTYTTPINTTLTVTTPTVLANDTPNTGVFAVLVGSENGIASLAGDGTFTFEPDTDFVGEARFFYVSNNGFNDSNVATVRINVTSPLSAADDTYTTTLNTPLSPAPNVLSNDSPNTGVTVELFGTAPAADFFDLAPDGTLNFTPLTDSLDSVTFQYRTRRTTPTPAVSNVVTVTININNVVPTATADTYLTAPGTTLTVDAATGVLANDTPAVGITAELAAGGDPTNGTLILNLDGSFEYTPNVGFAGTDTFQYEAVTSAGRSPATTVTITVGGTAVIALNDSYPGVFGAPTNIPAPGVLGNDQKDASIPEPLVVDVTSVTQPVDVSSNPAGTVVVRADGSFTFTPLVGFSGPARFSYRAQAGTQTSNVAIVTINVPSAPPTNTPIPATATPAPLVAVNDSYDVPTSTIFTLGAPGVLVNDTGGGTGALTAQLVTAPSIGSVVLNSDGSFTYTPTAGFIGVVTFQYRALQGSLTSNIATVTLNISTTPTVGVNLTAAAVPTTLPTFIPLFIPGPTPVPQAVPNGGQLSSAVCAPVPSDVQVVVNRDGVNVRLFPAIGAEVIGFVNAGYSAQVRARTADSQWVKVEFSGEEGWIGFPVISLISGNLDGIPVEDPRTIPYGGFGCPRAGLTSRTSEIAGILRDSGVRVRSGPSRAYVVLANAPRGTVFPIMGRTFNNAWFQVNFNGVLGWVIAREVELQNANFTDAPVDGIIADALPVSEPTNDSYVGTLRLLLDRLNIAQASLDAVRQRWTDAALTGELACGNYPASPTDYAVANPLAAAFFDTLVSVVTDFNSAMGNLRVPIDLLLDACTNLGGRVGQPQIQIALQAISAADGLFAAVRQRLNQLIPPDRPIGPEDCPFTFNGQTDILPRVRQGQLAVVQMSARNFVVGFCIDAAAGQQLRVEALAFQGNALPVVSLSPYDNPSNFIGIGRASAANTLVSVGPITIDRTAVYLVVLSDLGDGRDAPLDSRVAVMVTDITGASGGFLSPSLSIDPNTGQLIANPNPQVTIPQADPNASGAPPGLGDIPDFTDPP